MLDLPLFLIGMLAEHIHDSNIGADDLLFRGPAGGPLRYSNFRCRVFNPAVRQAALTGCTFHTLRQSAAGLMREVGAQEWVVQQRLGHANIRTTSGTYGWITPATNADLTQALDGLFTNPAEGNHGTGPA